MKFLELRNLEHLTVMVFSETCLFLEAFWIIFSHSSLNLMDQFKNRHVCGNTATEYMATELLYRQMAMCSCQTWCVHIPLHWVV